MGFGMNCLSNKHESAVDGHEHDDCSGVEQDFQRTACRRSTSSRRSAISRRGQLAWA